jgi:hypothetical protein
MPIRVRSARKCGLVSSDIFCDRPCRLPDVQRRNLQVPDARKERKGKKNKSTIQRRSCVWGNHACSPHFASVSWWRRRRRRRRGGKWGLACAAFLTHSTGGGALDVRSRIRAGFPLTTVDGRASTRRPHMVGIAHAILPSRFPLLPASFTTHTPPWHRSLSNRIPVWSPTSDRPRSGLASGRKGGRPPPSRVTGKETSTSCPCPAGCSPTQPSHPHLIHGERADGRTKLFASPVPLLYVNSHDIIQHVSQPHP